MCCGATRSERLLSDIDALYRELLQPASSRRPDQDLVEPLRRRRPNGKRRPLPFGLAPFSAV